MHARETPLRRSRARRVLLRAVLCAAGLVLALLLVEGTASLVVTVQGLRRESLDTLAERRHTRYDPLLGWVNVPDTQIADLYGPGGRLTINSQGFRAERTFDVAVPPGKLRAVCSGDSFTLGFGVADEDTWVHRLTVLEPRLETVNMGQGGYGVDQAYLWYERDGAVLEHDLHLVAFITGDFQRMQRDVFFVYPKPVLVLEQEELLVRNTPVPRSAYRFPWLAQNARHLGKLRTLELLGSLGIHEVGAPRGPRGKQVLDDEAVRRVALAVFEELARINRSKGSVLVAVHLPTQADHRPSPKTDLWRSFLARELARRAIAYVDLVEAFRDLPAEELDALFIPEGAMDVPAAAGHYTVSGNQLVAELLSQRLAALPEFAERLGAAAAD